MVEDKALKLVNVLWEEVTAKGSSLVRLLEKYFESADLI
jgi:hypothetical protein